MKLFYLLLILCSTAYADQCDDLINQWNENECCGLDGGICSSLKQQYAENCNCQSLQAVVDTTPSGACSTNPCFNSAICSNVGSDSYTCTCVAGYDGNNCENDIDECAPSPCVNAIYCEDLVNDYNCACNPGYEGKNCSTEIDECAVNPCVNGVCTDLFNDYSCSCYAGWEGDNCDIDIDDCASGLCGSNEYTCVDGNQTHTCDCTGTDSMGEFCNVTIVSSVEQDITIQVTAEQENNVDFILGLQCSVADAYAVTCDACAGGDIVDNTATCDAVSVEFVESTRRRLHSLANKYTLGTSNGYTVELNSDPINTNNNCKGNGPISLDISIDTENICSSRETCSGLVYQKDNPSLPYYVTDTENAGKPVCEFYHQKCYISSRYRRFTDISTISSVEECYNKCIEPGIFSDGYVGPKEVNVIEFKTNEYCDCQRTNEGVCTNTGASYIAGKTGNNVYEILRTRDKNMKIVIKSEEESFAETATAVQVSHVTNKLATRVKSVKEVKVVEKRCPKGRGWLGDACVACAENEYSDKVTKKDDPDGTCKQQKKCGAGKRVRGKMKFRDNDCLDCPLDSYSSEESYESTCTAQPPCSAGKRASDRTNKVSVYTCIDCDENTYSEGIGFECATQPVCEKGSRVKSKSKSARLQCEDCPTGKYSNSVGYQDNCQNQNSCGVGKRVAKATRLGDVECQDCAPGKYSNTDDFSTTCLDQPNCAKGEYVEYLTTFMLRVCKTCEPGQYQDVEGISTSCKPHTSCAAIDVSGDAMTDNQCRVLDTSGCGGSNPICTQGVATGCECNCGIRNCSVGQYCNPDGFCSDTLLKNVEVKPNIYPYRPNPETGNYTNEIGDFFYRTHDKSFIKITNGSTCTDLGMHLITTIDDCKTGIGAVQESTERVFEGRYKPYGCSFEIYNGRITGWVNNDISEYNAQCSMNKPCVCAQLTEKDDVGECDEDNIKYRRKKVSQYRCKVSDGTICEVGDFYYTLQNNDRACERVSLLECPINEQLSNECSCKGYSNCTSGEFCLADGTCVSEPVVSYPTCYNYEQTYELSGPLVPILSLGKDCTVSIADQAACKAAVIQLYDDMAFKNTVLENRDLIAWNLYNDGDIDNYPADECYFSTQAEKFRFDRFSNNKNSCSGKRTQVSYDIKSQFDRYSNLCICMGYDNLCSADKYSKLSKSCHCGYYGSICSEGQYCSGGLCLNAKPCNNYELTTGCGCQCVNDMCNTGEYCIDGVCMATYVPPDCPSNVDGGYVPSIANNLGRQCTCGDNICEQGEYCYTGGTCHSTPETFPAYCTSNNGGYIKNLYRYCENDNSLACDCWCNSGICKFGEFCVSQESGGSVCKSDLNQCSLADDEGQIYQNALPESEICNCGTDICEAGQLCLSDETYCDSANGRCMDVTPCTNYEITSGCGCKCVDNMCNPGEYCVNGVCQTDLNQCTIATAETRYYQNALNATEKCKCGTNICEIGQFCWSDETCNNSQQSAMSSLDIFCNLEKVTELDYQYDYSSPELAYFNNDYNINKCDDNYGGISSRSECEAAVHFLINNEITVQEHFYSDGYSNNKPDSITPWQNQYQNDDWETFCNDNGIPNRVQNSYSPTCLTKNNYNPPVVRGYPLGCYQYNDNTYEYAVIPSYLGGLWDARRSGGGGAYRPWNGDTWYSASCLQKTCVCKHLPMCKAQPDLLVSLALKKDCSCGTAGAICEAGKYCIGGTCTDAPKCQTGCGSVGLSTPTCSCTNSNGGAYVEKCDTGEYCWSTGTCSSEPEPQTCTPYRTSGTTVSERCKCNNANGDFVEECAAGKYCWSTGVCQDEVEPQEHCKNLVEDSVASPITSYYFIAGDTSKTEAEQRRCDTAYTMTAEHCVNAATMFSQESRNNYSHYIENFKSVLDSMSVARIEGPPGCFYVKNKYFYNSSQTEGYFFNPSKNQQYAVYDIQTKTNNFFDYTCGTPDIQSTGTYTYCMCGVGMCNNAENYLQLTKRCGCGSMDNICEKNQYCDQSSGVCSDKPQCPENEESLCACNCRGKQDCSAGQTCNSDGSCSASDGTVSHPPTVTEVSITVGTSEYPLFVKDFDKCETLVDSIEMCQAYGDHSISQLEALGYDMTTTYYSEISTLNKVANDGTKLYIGSDIALYNRDKIYPKVLRDDLERDQVPTGCYWRCSKTFNRCVLLFNDPSTSLPNTGTCADDKLCLCKEETLSTCTHDNDNSITEKCICEVGSGDKEVCDVGKYCSTENSVGGKQCTDSQPVTTTTAAPVTTTAAPLICAIKSVDFDPNNPDPNECFAYSEENFGYGENYRGTISKTNKGVECKSWGNPSTNQYNYVFMLDGYDTYKMRLPEGQRVNAEPKGTGSVADNIGGTKTFNNYCRNPDNDPMGPWCYVDECPVHDSSCHLTKHPCVDVSTYVGYSTPYRKTPQGEVLYDQTCQTWGSAWQGYSGQMDKRLRKSANACRDPDNTGTLWCYTSTSEKAGVSQTFCDSSNHDCVKSNCSLPNATDVGWTAKQLYEPIPRPTSDWVSSTDWELVYNNETWLACDNGQGIQYTLWDTNYISTANHPHYRAPYDGEMTTSFTNNCPNT